MTNRIHIATIALRRPAAVLLVWGALMFTGLTPRVALPAVAADLDGVSMPELLEYGGNSLRLNGMGMRTYSIFRVHIYVAGLYLDHPSADAEAILRSRGVKLLRIRFTHDVSQDRARDAWADGFAQNCRAPCHLRPEDLARFLAAVPEFHRGDDSTLLFTGDVVDIEVNGRRLGEIADPEFTRAVLAAFIGPNPPSEPFKHGLLGLQN